MGIKMSIHGALREFANTFREWHYIVSSFFTGAILGFFLAIYVMLRMLRRVRQ